ncbi:MAG TPA: nucleoside deaminase [Planctomycetota bacterium]|nr:nucleoside deaminase [Planctomycetota bacterium]
MASDPSTDLLERTIQLACTSARSGGGPFGAIVARDGKILGEGSNRVTLDRDPTAHAEVIALRAACAAVGSHVLTGAVLYTSCEPCPMCLAAAWWARVDRVVFCATRTQAAAAGFDDELLYEEVRLPLDQRRLPVKTALPHLADEPFRAWRENDRRVPY